MAYATLTDVEAKWRPLPSAVDQARVTALLEEAEAELDRLVPGLAANILAGSVNPVTARKVVTDAVIRVLANPSGVTMQTLGPESVQFAGVRTLGTVAFTKDELASLAPVVDDVTASAGGFTIGSATLALSATAKRVLGGWCD